MQAKFLNGQLKRIQQYETNKSAYIGYYIAYILIRYNFKYIYIYSYV